MAASSKDIQFRELKDMISQLNTTIAAQNELIRSLKETVDAKSAHEKVLQEQIDFLTKKLFGRSSEKTLEIPGQLSLFNEAEAEQLSSRSEDEQVQVKEHGRKKKVSHQDQFRGIKVNRIVEPLPEEDKYCSYCGTPLEKIGEEYVRRELIFIPAACEINEYYCETYGCPSCKMSESGNDHSIIVKSGVHEPLIHNSFATESAAAWTMYQKYVNAIPLYRQEKDWLQYGASITRATLASWIITCADHYLSPLYDLFHRELIKREFAMADETRIQVLHEDGRQAQSQSFMWLLRSGEDGLPPIVLYGYTPTRNGDHARDFLKGFRGYLMTDGYQGYNKVPDIRRCSCWAHIRRYFIDAIPKGKQFDYSQPAVQGVQYCDRLFRIEDSIRSKYPDNYEKRKELRLEKEKPVLEAFWSWIDQLSPTRGSRLDKALTYVNNRKESAMTYLEDGRCSFTNNLSENSIRPFTVGRKNWLFSNSVDGAQASAVVYTIVEMAKLYDLKIYEYLKYILEHRPDRSWTDEQLMELAPWSEKLRSLKNRM